MGSKHFCRFFRDPSLRAKSQKGRGPVLKLRNRVPAHRPWSVGREDGFTLMELLIVISIILILMLVALPTAGKIRKHAHELSAQKSLQTIEEAESMYESTYPANGYACNLTALAGDTG